MDVAGDETDLAGDEDDMAGDEDALPDDSIILSKTGFGSSLSEIDAVVSSVSEEEETELSSSPSLISSLFSSSSSSLNHPVVPNRPPRSSFLRSGFSSS